MDSDWTATEQWHGDAGQGQEQGTEAEHVCRRRRRVFKSVVGRTADGPQSSKRIRDNT